jgi:hypothetical protein
LLFKLGVVLFGHVLEWLVLARGYCGVWLPWGWSSRLYGLHFSLHLLQLGLAFHLLWMRWSLRFKLVPPPLAEHCGLALQLGLLLVVVVHDALRDGLQLFRCVVLQAALEFLLSHSQAHFVTPRHEHALLDLLWRLDHPPLVAIVCDGGVRLLLSTMHTSCLLLLV